jgi:ABC-type maltose transport system permease subunit
MNSEKEMLEQMKNDLDKLNDMLKKSEGKNYYRKEKAKVICKIIAPFVGFTGTISSLYFLTIGVPFMKHNIKAYLNKETTTYDDNTKSVYEYYQKKQSIKPMLYIYGTWVKENDYYVEGILVSSGKEKTMEITDNHKYKLMTYDADKNEFNYVLESNDATIVRNVCYILAVFISCLCGFAYNDSKMKGYKMALNKLKENYYEEYVKLEKIFKSRVENYELLSGEHYER